MLLQVALDHGTHQELFRADGFRKRQQRALTVPLEDNAAVPGEIGIFHTEFPESQRFPACNGKICLSAVLVYLDKAAFA